MESCEMRGIIVPGLESPLSSNSPKCWISTRLQIKTNDTKLNCDFWNEASVCPGQLKAQASYTWQESNTAFKAKWGGDDTWEELSVASDWNVLSSIPDNKLQQYVILLDCLQL